MGSYQPTILPAQPGFLDYVSQGIQKGGNAYASALTKKIDKSNTQKEAKTNYDKFRAFAVANGKNIEEGYTDKGPYFKTVEDKPLTPQDLQMGAAGFSSPGKYAKIGKIGNIQPEILPPEQTPGAAMSMIDGSIGDIAENPVAPVQADYGQTVMNALRKNPMVAKPGRQTAQPVPDNFANEFKAAHDSSAGDPDQFVSNLKDLALQYSDNPAVINHIKKLIDMNKTKKSRSGLSRLRG